MKTWNITNGYVRYLHIKDEIKIEYSKHSIDFLMSITKKQITMFFRRIIYLHGPTLKNGKMKILTF